MNKLLESILDLGNDNYEEYTKSAIDKEIDRQIIECMSKGWISTNTGIDKVTADDYTIKNHVVYIKKKPNFRGLKFYNDVSVPSVFRIGYCGKEFALIHTNTTDIEHIFDELSREGLEDLYYITIEDNKNLIKVPDFNRIKFNSLYILNLIDNPKLKVDAKKLPDTYVSLDVHGNKNKVKFEDIDRKLDHHIVKFDDYTNEEDYQ